MSANVNMQPKTALIMAAGTGGHIYPGLAIADALAKMGLNIVWLATPSGMAQKLVGKFGYPIETLGMTGVRGKGKLAWLLLPFNLLRAFVSSILILRRVKPDVVVSMGGYIAFPAGMMAVLLGKPLVVHEPGANAGLTNRVLALIADRVLVGFPHAFAARPLNKIARALAQPKKVEWLGTPVRDDITRLLVPQLRLGDRQGPLRLLVVGGSLGAKTMSELVVAALAKIDEALRPIVIHQSGEKNVDDLLATYQTANVRAEVKPFIDDMAAMYAWCDIIICRAGAITVAEIASVGVASILIPLPWFVAEEQLANAKFLSDADAGLLVNQKTETAEGLAAKILSMTRDKAITMAVRARELGKPDATLACAKVCAELAGVVLVNAMLANAEAANT
jgi:UDP-N-acetylglucosamine--N-acetylmuramyl-(pentapeptide) pyrophosphoryl-undecaprenol N-acetylglucosamine transferase